MPEDDAPSMLNLIGTPVASAAAAKKKSSTTKTKQTAKTPEKSQKQKTPSKETESEPEPTMTKPKKKEKKKQSKKPKKPTKQTKDVPKLKKQKPPKDDTDQINDAAQLNIKKQYDDHQQKKLSTLQTKNKPLLNKIRQKTTDETQEEPTEKGIQKVLHKVSDRSQSLTGKSSLLQKAILRKSTKTTPASGEIKDKPLAEQVKILQKQNEKLDNEIKQLEEKIETLKIGKTSIKTFLNKNISFIRDCVSIDKKRAEFTYMMDQMNQRKQKLEHLETDMIFEKKEFKKKIEEFFTWREKLEQLEQEIEKRRQYLEEHETFLNENFDKVLEHELNSPAPYVEETPQINEPEEEESAGIVEEDDLFEALTVEAVVLQRGRIKKVNSLFQQLIGYGEKDLVGKHLVDFVGPSGLAGVEQHYVNRLKGVDDISYDTVFLTEKEKEIPVHVKVKTGEFQGQRAEIATFREL